jgi:Rps23 Pro-64 3,4-dihydroxylase Tpa1-like proline 4-hydroxylase
VPAITKKEGGGAMRQKEGDLRTSGFLVLDDVVPVDVATQLHERFVEESKWELLDQVRERHYGHVFKFDSKALPHDNEVYLAKFSRSMALEQADLVREVFATYLIPILNEYSLYKLSEYEYRCYKLGTSDHYRTHVDGYASKTNLIYYVNKDWRWDWGGILNILSNDDEEYHKAIYPRFNRVVLLDNQTFKSPHYVSTVEKFALCPRYSIVALNK